MRVFKRLSLFTCILLGGCAHLEFPQDDGGLVFFEPVPKFLLTTTTECVTTGTVVMLPGARKIVKLKSGYGSSELSVGLTNGMISTVGQKSDPKIPETITAVAALAAALGEGDKKCNPTATLFPIEDGNIDVTQGTVLPVAPAPSK